MNVQRSPITGCASGLRVAKFLQTSQRGGGLTSHECPWATGNGHNSDTVVGSKPCPHMLDLNYFFPLENPVPKEPPKAIREAEFQSSRRRAEY